MEFLTLLYLVLAIKFDFTHGATEDQYYCPFNGTLTVPVHGTVIPDVTGMPIMHSSDGVVRCYYFIETKTLQYLAGASQYDARRFCTDLLPTNSPTDCPDQTATPNTIIDPMNVPTVMGVLQMNPIFFGLLLRDEDLFVNARWNRNARIYSNAISTPNLFPGPPFSESILMPYGAPNNLDDIERNAPAVLRFVNNISADIRVQVKRNLKAFFLCQSCSVHIPATGKPDTTVKPTSVQPKVPTTSHPLELVTTSEDVCEICNKCIPVI